MKDLEKVRDALTRLRERELYGASSPDDEAPAKPRRGRPPINADPDKFAEVRLLFVLVQLELRRMQRAKDKDYQQEHEDSRRRMRELRKRQEGASLSPQGAKAQISRLNQQRPAPKTAAKLVDAVQSLYDRGDTFGTYSAETLLQRYKDYRDRLVAELLDRDDLQHFQFRDNMRKQRYVMVPGDSEMETTPVEIDEMLLAIISLEIEEGEKPA
jgi:hypothetical protein